MKKVAVIMGSDSDLPIVEKAINTLKAYEVPVEVHVYSAHRTPEASKEFAENAIKNLKKLNFKIFTSFLN